MKPFILVALFFLLGCIYVYVRGWQLMPANTLVKVLYGILFFSSFFSFVIGMIGRNSLLLPIPLIKWLSLWGGTFLVVLMYVLLVVICIDLLRLGNYLFHYFPDFITNNAMLTRRIAAGVILFGLTILLSIGYYRFTNPVVKHIELDIAKSANGRKELNLVAISDVHLGFTIGKERLKQYVNQINALNPELILISGDLIDSSLRPLEEYRMYEELKQLKAPLGVYMVTGNHEYISDIEKSLAFIEKAGIHLLENDYALPDSTFIIVGQKDLISNNQKPIAQILENAPTDLPILGMNHQPQNQSVDEAVMNNLDFFFCGHTHQGQVWPGNKIVKMLYEVPYGYVQKRNTHIYVSSGLGLWGPPFRIGSQSEIVAVKLKFNTN